MTNRYMEKQGLKKRLVAIEEYKGYLKAMWKGSKPLAKLFKTDSCFYLYDTGTNKILKCLEPVFNLLEKLLALDIDTAIQGYLETHDFDQLVFSTETIKKAIESEKILLALKAEEFGTAGEFSNYAEITASSLEVLFLEVTDSCSLRCRYCVYGDHVTNRRNHGENSMTREIAYKAIDYLKEHSQKSQRISISFYGGEPLLEFTLIKSCVEYARSIFKGKIPDFSITTNGTLLSSDVAEFLHKNDFKVQVSLDGTEEIHDNYRVDKKGKGSFDSTIKGLKYLIETYGDSSSKKIFLNMVYTPPFSEKRLNRVARLWEEVPWLPNDLNLNISYPSPGSIPIEMRPDKSIPEDKNLQQWSFEKFREMYIGKSKSHPIANSIIERGIALLLQRPVYEDAINRFSLNGCCIPGVRRLYVDTSGKFRVCERISDDAPFIGDANSGIDLELIEKVFIDGYKEVITPYCSVCWAVGLCNICYTNIFKEGKLDFAARENDCYTLKKSQERFLRFYCLLQELDPKGLEYLYKYELM